MFRRNRAKQSQVVWRFAPPDQKAECQRLGLPLKLAVRFVSLRLPSGELAVLATALLDAVAYPTAEFLTVYHWRWGDETFYLLLKGRLELENFSGQTVAAVEQDVQAALNQARPPATQARQVNRANAYHALKDQVLALLYGDAPVVTVLRKLQRLLAGSPVAVRPGRKVPRRPKTSFHRSYNFQRRVKKRVLRKVWQPSLGQSHTTRMAGFGIVGDALEFLRQAGAMNSDLPATGTAALLELLNLFVPDDFINECWPHRPTGGRRRDYSAAQLYRVHLLGC